ncbi:hypothetical protein B0H17DRAFT_1151447 [Mycena rosella]|uniref:Uncharacterized protein n=1 Tax=Mycena rosella TaxID=1033263 RepID=A0AAD7FH50_MYCRO|nr:hypothetical protein B0H17DRAFT_1151447 [Mycena rosella]
MKRKCHVNNVLFTFPTAVSRNPAAGALPLVPALRRREATLPVNGCSGQNTVAGPSSNCALLPSHDATHSGDTTVVNTSLAFSDEDLSNITEEGSRLLQGILVHSDCSTVDFLPLYMEDRDPLAVDDPRPRPVDDVDGVATPSPKKWLDKRGRLLTPDSRYTFRRPRETVARSTPVTRKNHAKPRKAAKRNVDIERLRAGLSTPSKEEMQ